MSQRDKDSQEGKLSNFRVKWGYDEEELEDAVFHLAREQGRLPQRAEPETVYGCSLCDDWFAPGGLAAHEVFGQYTGDFRDHITSAHPDLPKHQWPSIVNKPLPQV